MALSSVGGLESRSVVITPSSSGANGRLPGGLAVVIVTYNSARVIRGCLASIPAALSGVPDHRVIVVDNASSDDTLTTVRQAMPSATVVRQPSNGGFASGVNAGVAAAGECDVLVLNADIRLEPGSVAVLREALGQPGTGIAVPALVDGTGGRLPSLRRRPTVLRALGEAVLGGPRAGRLPALGEVVTGGRRYDRPGLVDWATGAAWLVSRECLEAVGRLDERYFLYSEETEYMLRTADSGLAIRYQPAARAVHLGGEQSSSPRLSALATTNRVRLHRERHGGGAAAMMWLAVLLNEFVRALIRPPGDRERHRAGMRELLRMRRWPSPPTADPGTGTEPSYVCFSAQDWWYHNRAHSDFQLMRSLAERRTVLVVNSIGMRMPTPGRSTHVARRILRKLRSVAMFVRRPLPELPGFVVMSPLPLPFYASSVLRRLNALLVRAQVRAVCAALGIRRPAIVVTIPTAWDVVVPMRRHSLIYNRSDRHSSFPEADTTTIEAMERGLLQCADHVLYVSRSLLSEERAAAGARAVFLDHGVDIEHFRPRPSTELPRELAEIPAPRVGFFGALDDSVVDFDLLERVAVELPDVSLVLIGDASYPMERLTRHPNVHWLGFRRYEDIPAYGSGFDVALMPWADNPWIWHSNPIKLKEYLALGLPIVSTDFAEVAHYSDRVRVGRDAGEFIALIRRCLVEGGPQSPAELRASVLPASWRARAHALTELIEGASR